MTWLKAAPVVVGLLAAMSGAPGAPDSMLSQGERAGTAALASGIEYKPSMFMVAYRDSQRSASHVNGSARYMDM